MIASVNIADVSVGASLAVLRKKPKPGSFPGLRHADVAIAAPLGGSILPAPQVRRIAMVGIWDDDASIDRFLDEHPHAQALAGGWRVRLEPLRAWGTWPGLPDEVPRGRNVDDDGPAAVLTMGRVKVTRAVPFLRTSNRAENAVLTAPGLTWATGLARPPFVSTCSLWESSKALSVYAYGRQDPAHAHAIEADQAKPFHHQETFIRFRPYDSHGGLDGKNPLPAAWLESGPT